MINPIFSERQIIHNLVESVIVDHVDVESQCYAITHCTTMTPDILPFSEQRNWKGGER